MDRRALVLTAAAGFALAAPSIAGATDADALLARSNTGSLSAEGLAAGGSAGSLSSTAKPATSSSSAAASTSSATADELPFTGSDPRITLLLGFAATLAGAGLLMRTRDDRKY